MKYRNLDEWSFDEAQADDDLFAGSANDPTRPISRFLAFRFLEECEVEFIETRSGRAILRAIRRCANCDIVLPEWLARAYISMYDKVLNCQAGGWDDAFDKPFPKGSHLSALRKKRKLQMLVLNKVRERLALEPKTPIDKSLFEEVGNGLGLGATLTEEFYYSASHLLPNRRKEK